MNLEEKVEKKLIESKLIFRDKKITGEINKELKLIDFKEYSKEPISAEQLLEIDSHVETSEEIEELTNQQIFDLAMQREEEEEGEETTAIDKLF